MPGAPAALRVDKNTQVSHHRFAGAIPAFPARLVLTGSFVLFPATGLFVTVVGAMRKHCRQLGISIGMPEPHDFTVRLAAHSSLAQPSIHRIPRLTFVTIAKRPS
jgi:hypothetical protein